MGEAPTYRAEPFRVAVLGLNEITGLTVSHLARLRTEFLVIFLQLGGSSGCGCGGGGGDLKILQSLPSVSSYPNDSDQLLNFNPTSSFVSL